MPFRPGWSGGRLFTPASVPGVLHWWSSSDLADGLVGSWVDRVGGLNATAAGALRPTRSVTAINGRPGVTFGGAQALSAARNFSAFSGLRMLLGVQQSALAVQLWIEHTANSVTTNGGFGLGSAFDGASTRALSASCNGGGSGVAISPNTYYCATFPRVVSAGVSTAIANGTEFINQDGFSPALSNVSASGGGGGALANSTLNLGARSGGVSGLSGVISDIVIAQTSVSAGDLARLRTFLLGTMGFNIELGRVLCLGDSITLSSNGNTGGWRKGIENALGAAGVHLSFTADLSTASGTMSLPWHHGVAGETAAGALAYAAAIVAANAPNIIVLAYGMNDIGLGASPATYAANMETLAAACLAAAPGARIVCVAPFDPTAAFAPYFANIANYAPARTALAAMCTLHGYTYVTTPQPTLSDGVHPIDGAGGYPVMVDPIFAGLRAA